MFSLASKGMKNTVSRIKSSVKTPSARNGPCMCAKGRVILETPGRSRIRHTPATVAKAKSTEAMDLIAASGYQEIASG